jgi:Uncharacterized protein conserved in bacteria (DUF2169)
MSEPRLFALNTVGHPSKGMVVGVIAKRTYDVRNGQCLVAEEQVPLVEVPEVDPDTDALAHDMDIVLNRTAVDVVVRGKARAPGRRVFDARVRVAALDRVVRVFGDRRAYRDSGGHIQFSEPSPIEAIDVGWTSAYGGVDMAALAKHGDPLAPYFESQKIAYRPRFGSYVYPRNRAGKGYVIEPTAEALDACRLPNLEDPAHLLTPERLPIGQPLLWPAGPPPASFGWQAYSSFPRMAMLGLAPKFDHDRFPVEAFPEVVRGVIKPIAIERDAGHGERLDVAVAQQSAIGMRTPQVLPGAQVELHGLHPSLPSWSFAVPTEIPRMAIEVPRSGAFELAPQIRTVLLDPELDRLCVVWVGEHREAVPVGAGTIGKIRFQAKWVSGPA